MSGVICDITVAVKVKGNIYKRVVRPAVLFGVGGTDQKTRKRLRFYQGFTTAEVECFGDKVREARLG